MTVTHLPVEEKPAIVTYGDGRPVKAVPPTRAELLRRRSEAVNKIAELHKRHEPLILQAVAKLEIADREVSAAEEILRADEAKRLDARQRHESALRTRDNAIGEQERIIRENPDPAIRHTVRELEAELDDCQQRQTCNADTLKRIARIRRTVEAALALERDGSIINEVKLTAGLVALAATRNGDE